MTAWEVCNVTICESRQAGAGQCVFEQNAELGRADGNRVFGGTGIVVGHFCQPVQVEVLEAGVTVVVLSARQNFVRK